MKSLQKQGTSVSVRRQRPAFSLSNSLFILASILAALSSRHQQDDAKPIVGISSSIGVASAFGMSRPPPPKSLTKSTSSHRQPLFFFAAADENDSSSPSSSSNDGSFFFMNDAASSNPTRTTPTPSSVTTNTNGFTPRPPSIPPPPRLCRMRKATPPPPPTISTLFERKAVVLSSSITSSDNDPASNVDAIGTISDAFDQAKRAGARFFDGLELNLPHFGKGINANVDANANANAVKLFLRNFSNAATKAAEMVAPAIDQMGEAEEEMIVDVPKDTVNGAIFAALATAHVTAHSPILTAMAGCLAVYAVKSPGLGGDVARLVGSATTSIGYIAAIFAESTVNSAIASLPDPVEDGVVSLSKVVGGAINAAKEGMRDSKIVGKVVSEAIPNVQSQLFLALEVLAKALGNSANVQQQHLLTAASVMENERDHVEKESQLNSSELLTAASAISPAAVLQAVTEEEQARAEVQHNIVENIGRLRELASEKKDIHNGEAGVDTFQRNLLARQFRQSRLAELSALEADRRERLANMRRHMMELSMAEKKRSLDRLQASAVMSNLQLIRRNPTSVDDEKLAAEVV